MRGSGFATLGVARYSADCLSALFFSLVSFVACLLHVWYLLRVDRSPLTYSFAIAPCAVLAPILPIIYLWKICTIYDMWRIPLLHNPGENLQSAASVRCNSDLLCKIDPGHLLQPETLSSRTWPESTAPAWLWRARQQWNQQRGRVSDMVQL